MAGIPNDKSIESTISVLTNGYEFVRKRSRELNTDIFESRLLFQNIICMKGEEAAKVFYDNDRFIRHKAAPKRLQKTLLGEGGVQGLDDQAHRHRKQLFMSVMSEEGIQDLMNLISDQWNSYLVKWESMDSVTLFEEVQELIFRAVTKWAGIPVQEEEVRERTKEIGAMIDGSGAVGLRHYRGRFGRQKAEKWLIGIINKIRNNELDVDTSCPLYQFATHKEADGRLMDEKIASVELLNLIRPTVAIARFITFAALALHEHPEYRHKLKLSDDTLVEMFVQEVRRFYPFFPFVVAKVRDDFDWNGYHFPKGRKVLLDLYGTNHHPKLWQDPDIFQPERFRNWDHSAFNFIPQGGGNHHRNHRCAGEWITIETMTLSVKFLTRVMSYEVPDQDLHISLSRIPAIPKSRFIMKNVRRCT